MSLVGQIAELQNLKTYKELSWEGSFEDYIDQDDDPPARRFRCVFERQS